MHSTSLTVFELSLGYARKSVLLSDISFDASGGELIALLGRNGTGKSTLLRTLAGDLKPCSGSIRLNGTELASFSLRQRAEQIAYSPSRLQFEPLTRVEELVAFGRFAARGWLTPLQQTDREVIEKALEAVNLIPLRRSYLSEISDGERQRASIALALAQEASLLLLDEPTAYLDYLARQELVALLREVAHTQKRLVLYATHELLVATDYADRFLLVADGTVQEVSAEYVRAICLCGSGLRVEGNSR